MYISFIYSVYFSKFKNFQIQKMELIDLLSTYMAYNNASF